MKLELKENMYVRTKDGNIFKIIGGNVDNWEIDIDYSKLEQTEEYWLELYRYNDNYSFFDDKNIIKSSHNIIDLIEVGDYVNGLKVYEVRNDIKGFGVVVFSDCSIHECQIKSIVTKEQMEQMAYKVGD